MTQAYLLQVLIVDINGEMQGADEIIRTLENANYPNDCIRPHVLEGHQVVDIGEWSEEHPINYGDKIEDEAKKHFNPWRPIETVPKDGSWVILTNGKALGTECCSWLDDTSGGSWGISYGGYGRWVPTHWMPLNLPPARC